MKEFIFDRLFFLAVYKAGYEDYVGSGLQPGPYRNEGFNLQDSTSKRILPAMIKLNLRQNALHTIYHAVEHLYWSEDDSCESEGRTFDHDTHSVEWKDKNGHQCFSVSEFTRPPAGYNLKFALLHLIQGSELLLKTYVEQCEPTAIFIRPSSHMTIGLREALDYVVKRNPGMLTPEWVSLLLAAKELRNRIEHYEFHFSETNLRVLCSDFLAICAFLSQELLSISLVDIFSWDHIRDQPDQIVDYLSGVLNQVSETGRPALKEAGVAWAAENLSQHVFLCLNCGARAVSAANNLCMSCGTEGSEDIATLVEEFEAICRRLR
jgi:hypothetical protein